MGAVTLDLRSSSEEETLELGRALALLLYPGLTVLLEGDLGAGKTVFVRGIGEALGVKRVRSPSFTLMNEYVTPALRVVHVDLYRLGEDGLAVDELGLDDCLEDGCVLLVEWPERWKNPPMDDVLKISIGVEGENERTFAAEARGDRAERVLEQWRASMWKK